MVNGMAICPIQEDQLFAWCRRKGIDDLDEVDEYAYFVFELDNEYIEFMSKKAAMDRTIAENRAKENADNVKIEKPKI